MSESVQVVDYLDEFTVALKEQLLSDAKRWGDAWLDKDDVPGQETGVLGKITNYHNNFMKKNIPMPWLKVAGYALICWIRENHPEILEVRDERETS